jgi:cytochrome c oxidase subunit 3
MIAVTREAPERPHPWGVMGLLATVVMLFTAFTASYLVRRTSADWSPVTLPASLWLNTFVLLASSAALEAARRGARRWLGAAAALGALFLVMQTAAWRQLAQAGVFLSTSPHASFFYMLTAVHALHLAGGLVAFALVRAGRVSLGACAAYWHVLGGAWVWILVLLSTV